MLRRIWEFLRRRRLEAELEQEVEFHLAALEREHRARGLSAPDASAAALRDFGGAAQVKESYRDERGLAVVESLAGDLRYAMRGLRRSPFGIRPSQPAVYVFTAAVLFAVAIAAAYLPARRAGRMEPMRALRNN